MSRMTMAGALAVGAALTGMAAGAAAADGTGDYPVRPLPFTAVKLADGFWRDRIETNRAVTVWYAFKKCEETGRIDNFAKAGKLMPGDFRGTDRKSTRLNSSH